MIRLTRRPIFLISLFLAALFFPRPAQAVGEIKIEKVGLRTFSPDHYFVTGQVSNTTQDSREVVLRAQVLFYEKGSPKGDIPAMILRKDRTLVLRPLETRKVKTRLLNEGDLPRSELRLEPVLRVRRQRPWNY